MNYFSDMNMQGVSCEDYIQLLFCFNDGVLWNIADARQSVSVQKGNPAFIEDMVRWNTCVIPGRKIFFSRI